MPTKIIFGEKCIENNMAEFEKYGKNALIITGNSSGLKSGALSDVINTLSKRSITYTIYNGVKPNPSIDNVREATEIAINEKSDMIIGIGGGSPMDAAKAVALLAVQEISDDSLFSGQYVQAPLPVIAIPTTAGTGSEVTPYSILTDVKNKTKKNLSHESLFPKVAFLDPRYSSMLPYNITVNTAIDALSHSIESCLSRRANTMSTMVALEALNIIGVCLSNMNTDKSLPMEIRANLLYASMLAGMAIAQTGTTVVHAMGYPLTFYKNIDHGHANGLILREYLRYVLPHNIIKVNRILSAMNMADVDELESLLAKHVKKYITLSEKEIQIFSEQAIMAKSVDNTLPLPSINEIKELYRKSLGRSIKVD